MSRLPCHETLPPCAPGYSDSDPLVVKVLKSLHDVLTTQSMVTNSANIVQMGIHHEDKNWLIKVLMMYSID